MKHAFRIRRFIALTLSLLTMLLPLSGAFAESGAPASDLSGYIVILHTNDSLGRVDANLGFTRVAYAKQTLEAAGATVLLLDAGDTLHGLPFATVSSGESIVRIMNEVGYDAMSLGGRDFNYGQQRLLELADMAQFPMLCANALREDGTGLLPGSAIIERGYIKFGVFALASPQTSAQTSPDNLSGLTFSDPVAVAKAQVESLQAEGCTLIVALTHIEPDGAADLTCQRIAEQVDGVDLIVTGCSQSAPESGLWANNVLIAAADPSLESIGCIVIDPQGRAEAGLLTGEDLNEYAVSESIDQLIAEITASQEALLDEVIGQSSVALDGARELTRTQETNLGNLAADALRDATHADVALLDASLLRDSIPTGDLTRRQLTAVFPMGNYAVTMSVTGEQLLAALENGVSCYPAEDGRFPQVSGVTFRFDPDLQIGSRVFDVQVGDEPLQAEQTYLLATSDYMAIGGDGYPLADTPLTGEFATLEEILCAYIASSGELLAPQVEGRIVTATRPIE